MCDGKRMRKRRSPTGLFFSDAARKPFHNMPTFHVVYANQAGPWIRLPIKNKQTRSHRDEHRRSAIVLSLRSEFLSFRSRRFNVESAGDGSRDPSLGGSWETFLDVGVLSAFGALLGCRWRVETDACSTVLATLTS